MSIQDNARNRESITTINKILVNTNNLKDSPYETGDETWHDYNEDKVIDLVSEIVDGNKTCYVVSGYRGVGKTSFILRVKEEVEKLIKEKKSKEKKGGDTKGKNSQPQECIFVVTNFAKYENQKSFLRRMIRDVHRACSAVFKDKDLNEKQKNFNEKLDDLYRRTFLDIQTQLTTAQVDEVEISANVNVNGVLRKIAVIAQVFASSFASYFFIKPGLQLTYTSKIVGAIFSVIWFLSSFVTLNATFKKAKSKEFKNTIQNMYDDEIADTKFQELLDDINDLGHNLVFVLDELDKVNEKDLDNLIREMKPYLLSGKAHFILVTGQELAYRYLLNFSGEDAVISSLFSKFYHIPLFTKDNLQEFGFKLVSIENITQDMLEELSSLLDYYIFISKRIPRSFIGKFRQSVKWEANQLGIRKGYITMPEHETTELQVQALSFVNEIERVVIAPKKYEPVLHDYLITELFVNAQEMIFKRDYSQSIDGYLDRYQKSEQLVNRIYAQILEEILRDLFNRMKQAKIVKEEIDNNQSKEVSEANDSTGENKSKNADWPLKPAETLDELRVFKIEWINFTSSLNVFWDAESERLPTLPTNGTYYRFMDHFNSIGAISFTPVNAQNLIDVIDQHYLLEGDDRLMSFREQARSHGINPLSLQRQLTEYTIKMMLQNKLKNTHQVRSISGFDFAIVSDSADKPNILINFRHSNSDQFDPSGADKMAERLSEYNALTGKGNYMWLIETFFKINSVNGTIMSHDFNGIIEKISPRYYRKINYYPIPGRFEKNTFPDCAQTLLRNLDPYKP